MATKLRKLVITEVSLVDRGANQHARVSLFKRDAPIETPKDAAPLHFNASGRGPGHDALWASFDNHRRQLGPAEGQKAFARAWSELDDVGKQTIRDEEAATEAAKLAAAAAAEKERQAQMNKDHTVLVKAARAISAGAIENTVRASTWHGELRKMAAEAQEPGESIHQAVARLVKTDPDAQALFKASASGVADDLSPALPARVVVKRNDAHARLSDIAAGYVAANPKLTRSDALSKAFASHPDLATLAKRGAAAA
jgi:hypothetical protein